LEGTQTLAKNKNTSSKGTVAGHKPTREQVLKDLQRVHKLFPDANPDRDFYRAHGKYADSDWKSYFSTFKAFVKEAGVVPQIAPSLPATAVAVVQEISVADKLEFELQKLTMKKDGNKVLLGEAMERIRILEKEREAILGLESQSATPYVIQPKEHSGASEAVAFMIASDWHNEERVRRGDVSDLNEYNLDIFAKRADNFFRGGQRLWDIMRQYQNVPTLVLALLGDFITGSIHEDAAESNYLAPADAIMNAEEKIISGIDFLLEETDVKELVIPCHSGNHGRMTKKQRHSTEMGNSLEQVMYCHLEKYYQTNTRVKFQIGSGYHSYLNLWDKYLIRFHHGHNIKYGGGVGGITIPVNKAIDGWNKQELYRNVNLDVFGHFHQYINYGSFVCNGSLIGYNSYAVAIKAAFERPQQAFFLVSRKYMSKTMATPIFVE
jgi:hypothetical protein